MTEAHIPYQQIPEILNIDQGATLILAADITRLAMQAVKKEHGFDAGEFLSAFINKLGPGGTLVLPAYNFNLADGATYHPRKTKPVTGALAVHALQDEKFTRTRHPLHSFLCHGALAAALCSLDNCSSFEEGSPFGMLVRQNAVMLFLGTSVAEAFTFVHFAEELDQVWYRKYRTRRVRYVDLKEGAFDRNYCLYAKKPGWTMEMSRLESLLKDNGILASGTVNGVPWSMLHVRRALQVVREDIRERKARSIARFSLVQYFRDITKDLFRKSGIYRTPTDKISDDSRL